MTILEIEPEETLEKSRDPNKLTRRTATTIRGTTAKATDCLSVGLIHMGPMMPTGTLRQLETEQEETTEARGTATTLQECTKTLEERTVAQKDAFSNIGDLRLLTFYPILTAKSWR